MSPRIILPLVSLSLIASTGCVSQSEHAKTQSQLRDVSYKLEVAERTLAQRNKDLELARQAQKNADLERERMAAELANKDSSFAGREDELRRSLSESLAQSMRDKVRAELDAEYAQRMDELKQTMPTVEVSAYGGLVLEDSICFKPGDHILQPAGKTLLDPLIQRFMSAEFRNYSIELAGHTDSDPIRHSKTKYSDNFILAANRANAVRQYLIDRGVTPSRCYISGWGSLRPLTATSPKAKNRRVEIVLHREDSSSMDASAPR